MPRVEPPPLAPVDSFVVRCIADSNGQEIDAGSGCVQRGDAPGSKAGEYLIAMPTPRGATRKLRITI